MINEYIKSDVYRYYGCCNFKTIVRAILNPTLRFQMVFRCCQMNGIWHSIGKVLWLFGAAEIISISNLFGILYICAERSN